jgi:hypothetical protein
MKKITEKHHDLLPYRITRNDGTYMIKAITLIHKHETVQKS